ncbi:YoaK family protein [Neisseria sp. Ec49-e6-T10]|uniref:YoaK family protein n=1 Tax=Neisseria sp. Ec49-e6-T10 TaxID=3140744 RepID=UPI003EC0389B
MNRLLRLTLLLDNVTFEDNVLRNLGYIMAFIAGAINAGGFFAVNRYTSHISGVISSMADGLILADIKLVLIAFSMLFCFIAGAIHATWLILWARRRRFRGGYGLSMWVEATYLLIFGLLGASLSGYKHIFTPPTLMLLCFIMGMHNTVVTKLSGGLLRSTHMTGIATDIGIELAKLMPVKKFNSDKIHITEVNRRRLTLFLGILFSFFIGGIIGALGFRHLGYQFTLPLSFLLFIFGCRPIYYDIKLRVRFWLKKRKKNKNSQVSTS